MTRRHMLGSSPHRQRTPRPDYMSKFARQWRQCPPQIQPLKTATREPREPGCERRRVDEPIEGNVYERYRHRVHTAIEASMTTTKLLPSNRCETVSSFGQVCVMYNYHLWYRNHKRVVISPI
jgi:hypothetical protein